jgi:hypothetical protein
LALILLNLRCLWRGWLGGPIRTIGLALILLTGLVRPIRRERGGLALIWLAGLSRAISLARVGLALPVIAGRHRRALNPVVGNDSLRCCSYCGPATVLVIELLPILLGLPLHL